MNDRSSVLAQNARGGADGDGDGGKILPGEGRGLIRQCQTPDSWDILACPNQIKNDYI